MEFVWNLEKILNFFNYLVVEAKAGICSTIKEKNYLYIVNVCIFWHLWSLPWSDMFL